MSCKQIGHASSGCGLETTSVAAYWMASTDYVLRLWAECKSYAKAVDAGRCRSNQRKRRLCMWAETTSTEAGSRCASWDDSNRCWSSWDDSNDSNEQHCASRDDYNDSNSGLALALCFLRRQVQLWRRQRQWEKAAWENPMQLVEVRMEQEKAMGWL